LVIAAGGLGKRVPVDNFRLQNRAGMGLVGMKFRKDNDELVALRVVSPRDELMLVTQRGIIIRQAIDAISIQSRMATGVQLQRLDGDDAIAAVAVVPELDIDEENTLDDLDVEATADADASETLAGASEATAEASEDEAPETTDTEDAVVEDVSAADDANPES
ncbi:MAG: DNA gyrase C-terminal beta-propeller domain-containing protein, partial [Cyanobacteria bacterium P01_F01_bin.116]